MNEIIDIPVPEGTEIPKLNLFFGAGELILSPGDTDALLSGEIMYADERLKPVFTGIGNEYTFKSGFGDDLVSDLQALWESRDSYENLWNLHVGAVPLDLVLRVGAAKTSIDLGNLSLHELLLEQGATDLAVDFSSPNHIPMEKLTFSGGASRSILRRLRNTRAKNCRLRGGAGDYLFDFSGDAADSMSVTIDAGVGRVVVAVPADVPAVLIRKGGLTAVSGSGSWRRKGDLWLNGDADDEDGMGEAFEGIRAVVTMGLGALELKNTSSD